jgi:signal transduction histidine kinase
MGVAMWWGHWAGTSSNAQSQVEREADRVAFELHQRMHNNRVITVQDLRDALPAEHRVELTFDTANGGQTLSAGASGNEGPASVETVDGVGTIRLIDATGDLHRNQWLGVVVIVAVCVFLTIAAVFVAFRASRRMTTPLSDLAEHAEQLSSGDLRPSGQRYGVAELDRLADSMDASVLRVASLLAEERTLTLDASHQLKTPLTALSLRLEELAEWPDDPDVRAEAAAALEQVERLSGVVDELLVDRRSPESVHVCVPLSVVIDQQLAEWRPAFSAARRELVAIVDPESEGAVTLVEPGPVGQVIASLIENSLVHGAGRTSIEARAPHGTAWVEVFDEGAGVSDDLAARVFDRDVSGTGGTGLGLASAQDAAVSVGGRIALVHRRPAHFRFFLNRREYPPSIGPESEQRAEAHTDDVG